MAVDLHVPTELRESGEWSIVAPANISSYLVTVPYDPAEWVSPRRLLITAVDGAGAFLGSSENTTVAIDKITGLPRDFYLEIVMGIEREDIFPADKRAGRTIIIDGVRYRQVLIESPLVVRITVDGPTTYGLDVTLGIK